MKKLIMGFAAFTLALTSCQKQDLLDHIDDGSDRQIQIAVYQGTATKAAELMNSSLQKASGTTPIPLYAYTGAQSAKKALYFEEALTWSPTAGKWNTANPRFLPQTGVLQFYTYYPIDGVVYKGALTDGAYPTLDYTIQGNGLTTDLVAAALNDHASTKIVIPMRHILSQINFGVKGYYGAKIEIKDIKIWQVNSSGTFTLNNTDETTWVWSSQKTPADYPYVFSEFTTPGADVTNATKESDYTYFFGDGGNCGPGYGPTNGANKWYVGNDGTAVNATTITPADFANNPENSLMLLPQNLATGMSAAYVTFNYRISDLGNPTAWIVGGAGADTSSYVEGKFDLHFTTGTGANEYDKKWDPNYRYVYIIDFTNFLDGQKLTFDVDVQLYPWENYNSGGDNDGLIYISSLGEPIFETHIKGLINRGSYTLPAGNVFSDNSWDWSKYIMTNAFTAADTFAVNFSNITFNGNSITVVPPVGFNVSNSGVADATNTTLTFTPTHDYIVSATDLKAAVEAAKNTASATFTYAGTKEVDLTKYNMAGGTATVTIHFANNHIDPINGTSLTSSSTWSSTNRVATVKAIP